ncbi:MAG TPA: hypothetical protein VFQ61_11925 [Polyangiaceae bacterium]|nr:hypothetical protein [Polyangiaceae bacterium]
MIHRSLDSVSAAASESVPDAAPNSALGSASVGLDAPVCGGAFGGVKGARRRSVRAMFLAASVLAAGALASCGETEDDSPGPSGSGGLGSGGVSGRGGGGATARGGASQMGGRSSGGSGGSSARGGRSGTEVAGAAGSEAAGAPSAGASGLPEGGQSGSSEGGQGGESSGPSCGNGVRDSGEMCCTRAFVDTQIEAVFGKAVAQAKGTHSCVEGEQSTVLQVCDTARCIDDEPGCDAEIVGASADYDASTRTVTGNIDMTVRGHMTIGSGRLSVACDFTAVIDDLAYSADVVSVVSADAAQISLENLQLDYTVQVQDCDAVPGADAALGEAAKGLIEPRIVQQISETFQRRIDCPF